MRAGGPRPSYAFKNKCQEPDLSVLVRVPTFTHRLSPSVFAPRKRRYQVRRLTPRSAHGCRSVSEPARRTSPERRGDLIHHPGQERAAYRHDQPPGQEHGHEPGPKVLHVLREVLHLLAVRLPLGAFFLDFSAQ